MINKIKKLLCEITEDYKSDKNQLSEASSIFENFTNQLPNIKPESLKYLYIKNKGHNFLSYLIDYSRIDNNHDKLYFLLVGNKYENENSVRNIQYEGDPSYISDKDISDIGHVKVVLIPLGYSTVLETYSDIQKDWGEYAEGMFKDEMKKIQHQVLGQRYIVIHELVHYLDDLRYKSTYSDKSYKNPSRGHSFQDYVNQPTEYNAFYTQSIYKLNQGIESDLTFDKKEKVVEAFKTFDDFLNYYKEYCDKYSGGRIPNFDVWYGKYFKKISKRLYQYYVNKKRELGV